MIIKFTSNSQITIFLPKPRQIHANKLIFKFQTSRFKKIAEPINSLVRGINIQKKHNIIKLDSKNNAHRLEITSNISRISQSNTAKIIKSIDFKMQEMPEFLIGRNK